MISISEFKNTLQEFIPQDSRPVVIYSGMWYLGRSFTEPFSQVPKLLNEMIIDLVGSHRTLLMPTYTSGFKNGAIDLDKEPSQTGALTEIFRKTPGVLRTASTFFSFAALGPDAKILSDLRPVEAWGAGSVFEWIEKNNAHLVSIGESWDACSMKHRAEWLKKVPYRYNKDFTGLMTKDGKREQLTERLFVRSLDPNVENVWNDLVPTLLKGDMRTIPLGGGQLAHMSTDSLMKQMDQRLSEDIFTFTQDPKKIRTLFEGKS